MTNPKGGGRRKVPATGRNIKKSDIVEELIKLRLEQNWSTHSLVEYTKEKYGYKQTYAYEIIKDVRDYMASLQKDWAFNALEQQLTELENQLERAKQFNERKLILDITKEINKLKGLYVEKVEHSITTYSVKLPGINDNNE